jgi:beta-N-acetylhexosaminidase
MPRPTGRVRRHRPSVYRRRRLTALAALAASILVLGLGLGSILGGDESEDEAMPRAVPEPNLPVRKLLGQRLVVRMEASATGTLMRAARDGEIAGVIVFPPPGVDPRDIAREIDRLQRAARDGGQPPLLVSTDQEGGEVKRFPDAPPAEAPPTLGEVGPDAARAAGEQTGSYLMELGINVDLAPVLDVAWTPDSAIAARAFGTGAEPVSDTGTAFATGLSSAGVRATAKHFPGIGRATGNTDLEPVTIDASRADLEGDLEPFRTAIADGIPMVMLSNATYPALDRRAPATWSQPVATDLLRDELGFEGVGITDDLGAGAVTAELPPERAAVRAAGAGADLLLLANEPSPERAFRALLGAARSGELKRDQLEESYERVVALKSGL